MTQPASKRFVTEASVGTHIEAALDDEFPGRLAAGLDIALDTKLPPLVNKAKIRLLGDQFDPSIPGSVPASTAVVSLTSAGVVDGYTGGGPAYHPTPALDYVDGNWSAATLAAYGSSFINLSKANATGTAFDFTTILEGTYAVFSSYKLSGTPQDLRVWIDDIEVTDWYLGTRATGVLQTNKPIIPCTTDNVSYYLNINFPNRGVYKIRIAGMIFSGTSSLMASNATNRFHKPRKRRVFGIISDSWYDTISASGTSLNPGIELSARMGWKAWNMANGGTGFVNPGPGGSGNPMHFGSDNVFASLLKAPTLELLLLNGSDNDLAYPEADVIAAMQAFFARWRTVRPDTPIIWQGLEPVNYFENIYTAAAMITREANLAAVALADPNVIGVILPAAENWLSGTGNSSAPNGTGNQDFDTGPDGVHLTALGSRLNGRLAAARMASIPTWRAAAA